MIVLSPVSANRPASDTGSSCRVARRFAAAVCGVAHLGVHPRVPNCFAAKAPLPRTLQLPVHKALLRRGLFLAQPTQMGRLCALHYVLVLANGDEEAAVASP